MPDTVVRYRAKSQQGSLETVDFSTVAGKRFAFFQLRDPAKMEQLKRALVASPMSQTLVVTTYVSGKPMLVTEGDATTEMLLEKLALRGEPLEKVVPSKTIDPWKIRSIFGFGGQTLQLASTFMRAKTASQGGKGFWKHIDSSIFVFAAANLAANVINLVYHQGEQVEDVHQQRYLKQRVNRELAPHLKDGEAPLDIDDNRQALRPQEESHGPLDKAKGFLKRHSVEVGELGLRYLGAVGLAFPVTGWKSALTNKQMPATHPAKLRVYAGVSSIFGKTVALTSAIPDPYNPKPPTVLDHLREKGSFLAGGLIEITSFSALAYDSFAHTKGTKNGLTIGGKQHRDWLGGVGASMFVMGYIARLWAKFGERNVNMNEIYAHVSDTLAETPPEKVPQLLANTAASLTEHFQDKPGLTFATIYTNLANDLTQFHTRSKTPNALIYKANNDKKPTALPPVAAAEMPANRVVAGTAETAPLAPRHALAMH